MIKHSCYPENCSNVYIFPVPCHRVIGRHFTACNKKCNHNSMVQYDVALEKYWAIQGVYFRLATTLELGMGITDGKLLLFHVISDKIKYKTISMR